MDSKKWLFEARMKFMTFWREEQLDDRQQPHFWMLTQGEIVILSFPWKFILVKICLYAFPRENQSSGPYTKVRTKTSLIIYAVWSKPVQFSDIVIHFKNWNFRNTCTCTFLPQKCKTSRPTFVSKCIIGLLASTFQQLPAYLIFYFYRTCL